MIQVKQQKHKHDHCVHEHLKFCNTCQRPYCLDCQQEWIVITPTYSYLSNASSSSIGVYAGVGTAGLAAVMQCKEHVQ